MILKLEKLIKTWTIQQLKVLTNPLTARYGQGDKDRVKLFLEIHTVIVLKTQLNLHQIF